MEKKPFEWVKERRIPLISLFPFVLLLAIILAEYYQIINYVKIDWPLNAQEFAQMASGAGSLILSYALVILYWSQRNILEDQTSIQENQEEMMKQDYVPHISAEISSLNIVSSSLRIRNIGDGPAFDVTAYWNFGGQSRDWEIPSLVPDEDFNFPLLENEEGNWLLSTKEIEEYLDSSNEDYTLEYVIECKDMFGEEHIFNGEVDFEVMSKRAEANEMWDNDPIEDINNEVSKMRRDIRKISGYAKKEKRNSMQEKKRREFSAIKEILSDHEEVDFDTLTSYVGVGSHRLQRRLETMEELGEIRYDETTGRVVSKPGLKGNNMLSDYES